MGQYIQPGSKHLRIDVKQIHSSTVLCQLVTTGFSAEIMLKRHDYDKLVENRFFVGEKTAPDSKILNSTEPYICNSVMTTD